MDYKWVLPDALAQAGFFHQPSSHGDDRTICFACDLCLVAWEQQDQPWSEHERHSSNCLFVRGEITENVPLALTASNQCASQVFKLNEVSEAVVCTSELSSERYFAVSNTSGHIVVYDSKDLLKEMMHVQLLNESPLTKDQPLVINTLCFYYRNHKHVLYGSFTINNEVFVFSFNIFDIYRSYNSKSNKKPSKSQKSSSSSKKTSSTATNATSNISLATTKTVNLPETVTIQMPKTVTLTDSKPVVMSTEQPVTGTNVDAAISTGNSSEFSAYINDIIKLKIDDQGGLTEVVKASKLEKQDSSSSTNKEEGNSETEQVSTPTLPPLKVVEGGEETTVQNVGLEKVNVSFIETAPKTQLSTTNSNLKSSNFSESLIINNNNGMNSLSTSIAPAMTTGVVNSINGNSVNGGGLSLASMTGNKMSFINLANGGQLLGGGSVKTSTSQAVSSNLSNFLVVRFELLANQETNSKSKSKYKKSIKIVSVRHRIMQKKLILLD